MIRNLFRRNDNLSCNAVMELLQSYLDGETDADSARRVAAHLDACNDCDFESTTYRRIKQSLAAAVIPVDPVVLASLRQFSDRVVAGDFD